MACGCNKNKGNKDMTKKKSEIKGKTEKQDLLYIMNPKCGWCKKADPVVEELVKSGYEITTLDITKPEQAERANEAKTKHNAQCGTPLFLDAESGNAACGFREKDVLEKWAKGEEMPAPPPRQQPKPQQGNDNKRPTIEPVKLEYIWLDNNESRNIRSKVRFQRMNVETLQNANPNQLLSQIAPWDFDGSSTNQSTTESSDCGLKPVRIIPNPMESSQQFSASYIVLCEVLDAEDKPHETNTRSTLIKSLMDTEIKDLMVGFEQEYVMMNSVTNKPIGWETYEDGTPPPQGNYYCGIGANNSRGRQLATMHAAMCNKVGISVVGVNAEVMLSQWEYQTPPKPVLLAADDIILSRFILQRLAEDMGIYISYNPKEIDGDWNGSGGHINFSTDFMRRESDIAYLNLLCGSMENYHEEALSHYGAGNDKRLNGTHETSSMDEFTWGELDRTASIRIPKSTVKNGGRGHLEDRRPAANIDPYEAFNHLLNTINDVTKELMVETA